MLCYETPLAPLAAYLREYINVETASDSMSADDAIVLTTDPTLGREAYTLAVKPQRIEITGGDYGGVFNGIQALLRLLPPKVYAKACPLPVEVACTRIDDAPRFAYRGMTHTETSGDFALVEGDRVISGAVECRQCLRLFKTSDCRRFDF